MVLVCLAEKLLRHCQSIAAISFCHGLLESLDSQLRICGVRFGANREKIFTTKNMLRLLHRKNSSENKKQRNLSKISRPKFQKGQFTLVPAAIDFFFQMVSFKLINMLLKRLLGLNCIKDQFTRQSRC